MGVAFVAGFLVARLIRILRFVASKDARVVEWLSDQFRVGFEGPVIVNFGK